MSKLSERGVVAGDGSLEDGVVGPLVRPHQFLHLVAGISRRDLVAQKKGFELIGALRRSKAG